MIDEINDKTIKEYTKSGVAIIDCYANWCHYCTDLETILEQIAKELPEIRYGRLNIDENPKTTKEYGIKVVPTIIAYKDGKVIDQMLGLGSKEKIKEKFKEYLQKPDTRASSEKSTV